MGSQRVGHDRVTFTFFPFHLGWTSLYNIVQQLYFNEKKKGLHAKTKTKHRNKSARWWLPGAVGWGKWGGVDQTVPTSVIR